MKNKKWKIALATIVMAVVLLAIYWRDEPLSAKTIALNQPPVVNINENENAYFAYIGLTAAKGKDPAEVGKAYHAQYEAMLRATPVATYQQFRQLIDQPRLKFKAEQNQHPTSICKIQNEACVEKYARTAEQISKLAADNITLAQRYNALLQYPQFVDVSTPSAFFELSAFSDIQNLNELRCAQASIALANGDADGALNALDANLQFWHRNLRGSTTLISRMIAIAILKTNYAFLNDFLDYQPALAKTKYDQLRKILAHFGELDTDFTDTLKGEYRFGANFMSLMITNVDDLQGSEPERDIFEKIGMALNKTPLYRPHATLNRHAEIFSRYLSLAKLPAHQLMEKKQTLLEGLENEFGFGKHPIRDFSYNPIGNSLNSMGLVAIGDYFLTAHDLGAYVRLLKLKLEIRHQDISLADVSRFIATSNAALFNPFTNQPMTWDEAGQSIYFNKLHGNENEKKVRVGV